VADALRGTIAGSKLVQPLTAAPDLDGWAITERLLKDLAPLEERIWLAIDDLHELSSAELRQLELLVTRTPPQLRFVLSARHDVRLGLHRLRLEGELSEIRAADLAFSPADARALFEAAGAELSGPELALLQKRTEGWAAGLRLAALSLAGHPDPERFAADFSGSERTVAGYLLSEVLDRESEPVRRLLLRTSVLERVNGELADLLTGGSGGERILQDLEDAGAFVVCLDASRSWFRYHRLFADLLQLELRRSAPDEVTALHAAAARWYAEHGYPVEAVRHAQAALDWGLAVRVLSDHFLGLVLGGQGASAYQLLARFPADVIDSDAELATLMAAHELLQGSPATAERYRARAVQRLASVPADRRERFQVELAIMRLCLAQGRGDLLAVVEEADRLLAPAADADAERPVDEDLRALALVTLGAAEVWALRPDDAEQHLEQGTALARRTGWPWLEVSGLAHLAIAASFRSFELEAERSMQVIELARQHGWTDEPVVAVAYVALAGARAWQGRLADAEPLLDHAERTLRAEVQPVAGVMLYYLRGLLELARGRNQEALAAFRAGEQLTELVVAGHPIAARVRAFLLHALIRLGQTRRAEQALAEMAADERETAESHVVVAALRIEPGQPPSRDGRSRTHPRRLHPHAASPRLADAGAPAGDRRAKRPRRPRRRRARPRARTRSRRARGDPHTVPPPPSRSPPPPSRPRDHRPRSPDPGHPDRPGPDSPDRPRGPIGALRGAWDGGQVPHDRGGSGGDRPPGANTDQTADASTARIAQRQRGPGPSFPADQSVGTGDRG